MQNLSTQDRAFRETLTDVLAGQGAGEVLDLVRSSSGLGADRDGLETRLAVVWALGKTGDQRALDLLEEWATDRDAALRASVAGAVAKLPGERAEEILSRMLGDPNERVRAAAVNALGATGATAAVDELAKLTLDPDAFVRNRVAVAVGRLGGIRAGELLEQLMADDDPVRKAYAAIGFGLCGDEHGFQMALAALSDGALRPIVSEKLVREAPEVKARFRKNLNLNDLDPTGSELLSAEQLQQRYVDELQSGQRPERRVAAVQALTSLGLDEHVPVLLRAARADPEPEVRRLALLGMCDESPRGGQMGPDRLEDDEVRDAVAGALKDPDPGVRTVAVGCAERIGDAGNNDALLRCFLVGDDGLHGATVSALAKVNTARVRDFVDEVMAHTDERVLQGAVKTLGQIGDRSVVRLLGMWLRSGSTSMRVACIDALGRVGDAGARDALTGCLGDPSVEIRLEALGRLVGLPGTRAALMRLARDPSANVRSTLVRRAAQRRNEATLVVAETLAQDGEDTVRADALLALLELGTPSELKRFLELHDAQPATVAETLRMAPADEAPVPALLSAAATAAAPEHRALALECAGRLNRTPEPLLLTAMEDPSPEIRIAAVRASTGMESKALDEALDRLLRDPVQEVRDEVRKGRMRIVGGGAA